MASTGDQKGQASQTAFDPKVWVDAQRRNLEAFTTAGKIVADSMRGVAERQAAMVQEAMRDLWGEVQAAGKGQAKPAQPQEQLDRMRTAFERAVEQIQEMSSAVLRAQQEAMQVLNRCASENMDQFGRMAPDLASFQKAAADAMQAATAQVAAAVDEMRRRMSTLEDETRRAMGGAADAAADATAKGTQAAGAGARSSSGRGGSGKSA